MYNILYLLMHFILLWNKTRTFIILLLIKTKITNTKIANLYILNVLGQLIVNRIITVNKPNHSMFPEVMLRVKVTVTIKLMIYNFL